jgi:hypothetical protein
MQLTELLKFFLRLNLFSMAWYSRPSRKWTSGCADQFLGAQQCCQRIRMLILLRQIAPISRYATRRSFLIPTAFFSNPRAFRMVAPELDISR